MTLSRYKLTVQRTHLFLIHEFLTDVEHRCGLSNMTTATAHAASSRASDSRLPRHCTRYY